MLRKLMPYLLVVLLVLIDSCVIPVFVDGALLLPAALLFVIAVGLLRGRIPGMLCGLLGGLLVDILTGYSLGYMMISYVAIGYLAGLLGYDNEKQRQQEDYSRPMALLRRVLTALALMLAFEAVTLVYQYFNTALMRWVYIAKALERAALGAALATAFYYAFMPLLVKRAAGAVHVEGRRREVRGL